MLYVVQVMAGMEDVTEKLLRAYLDASWYSEIFVPRYVSMRRYGGVWHDILRAMFPGYVFVETEQVEKVFARLKFIPQGMRLIFAEREFLVVYPEEEKFLRDMLDEEYIVQLSRGFMIGDRLYITEGALKQYQGKIIKIDRHKRVVTLSVNLFGRETPVEVGLEVVKKVPVEAFEEWKEEVKRKNKKKNNIQRSKKWKERFEDGIVYQTKSSKRPLLLSEREGAGEIVIVKSGIFEGLEAEVISRTEDMISARLLLMGSEVKMDFRPDEVEESC